MPRLTTKLALALAPFLLLTASPSPAQPTPRDGSSLVTAEVITNTPRTSYTQPIKLALKLTIAPKWHIYWLNPGDSGMPTSPKLKLPDGWTASEWRFPTPIKFDQPGGFLGYGYKDQAILLVDITPPQSFTSGQAEIEIETVFLVCEEICLPGHNKLKLTIPAGAPEITRHDDFVAWEALTPHLGTKSDPKLVSVTGEPINNKTPTPLTHTITLPMGAEVFTSVEIFPYTPDGLEVTNLTATPTKEGAIIKMDANLYSGEAIVVPTLPAVVVWSTAEGRRVAHWFDLPIPSSKPAAVPSEARP